LNITTISLAFLVEFVCIRSEAINTRLDVIIALPVVVVMLALGTVITITLMDPYICALLGIESNRERQAASEKKLLVKVRAVRVAKLTKTLRSHEARPVDNNSRQPDSGPGATR
jgi:hypothetical protein